MALPWSAWIVAWIGLAVVTFVVLLVRVAPYGRHTIRAAGPTIPHRVGWIVMETVSPAALLALVWFTRQGDLAGLSVGQVVLIALWVGHYVFRAWIYPFLLRWENRRMPIVIMVSAVIFNVVNGSINGGELALRSPIDMTSAGFLLGALLFVSGLGLNILSDRILRNLRKPGETGYQIPQGGAFRFVSCPNYLGEIIEWIGFALMAGTPAALSFAIWTAANLIPRALSHHRWYKNQFAVYPRHRKAVIPFML